MEQQFNHFVNVMFNFQIINKVYHWNTTSFARHKATDGFDDVLGNLLDRFVEVCSGRYNIKPNISNISIENEYLTDNGIVRIYTKTRKYLEQNFFTNDTELLNIRDELIAEINKTLYLFRLN
jgi:hypothetical protein